MNSRNTWLLIVGILALGLFIEGLKHWRTTTDQQTARTAGISLTDMDVRPFHVDSDKTTVLTRNRKSGRGMGLNAKRDSIDSHDFGDTHKVAQKAKVSKTEDKKKKKKKKKKARGKGKQKGNVVEIDRPYYDESDESKVTEANNDGSQFVEGIVNTNPPEKSKDIPLTFEDWAKLVLGSPNRAEVLRMIEFYQSNLITAEVFYGILTAMFETNNETQQLLAVEAAGSVASPSSFVFLMSAYKSLRSGTPIANAVTMRLNNYQSVGSVSHLRPVLDSHMEDQSTAGYILKVLDQSTESNITNANDRTPTENNPAEGALPPAQAQTQRLAQVYLSFEATLERAIVNYGTGSELAQLATRSLERIRSLKTPVVVSELNQ